MIKKKTGDEYEKKNPIMIDTIMTNIKTTDYTILKTHFIFSFTVLICAN